MVRRRPVAVAVAGDAGAAVLPAELTVHRLRDWPSSSAFHAAQREWLHAHDFTEQVDVMRVRRKSRRTHAAVVRDLDSLGPRQRIAGEPGLMTRREGVAQAERALSCSTRDDLCMAEPSQTYPGAEFRP